MINIEANKNRYIELINSITREGFNKELFLRHLENSDFFVAPASTRFHGSVKGGLCQHILNVYDNLVSLVTTKHLNISEDSIKIVSLFHDIAKMNYYEIYYKNQKVYSEEGTKVDEGGRYDWKQVSEYKTRDISNRFLYCNHEVTSEFITRQYIPLSVEESIAILHHHGGTGEDSVKDTVSAIYNRYPLATLLHTADLIASYIDESTE